MSIVVIGVNHRTGPLSVLERLTIAPDDVAKAVVGLAGRDNLREVAVLSTCNRTEVYAVAERFHGAYADIRDFLCELGGARRRRAAPVPLQPARRGRRPAPVRGRRRARLGRARRERDPRPGARRVAGRRATRAACARRSTCCSATPCASASGPARETAIGRGTASISHAAVEMVTDRLGSLGRSQRARRRRRRDGRRRGHRAAPGRGRPRSRCATARRSAAAGWPGSVGGRALGLDRVGEALAACDVVVACTASGQSVRHARRRRGQPAGRHARC